MSTKQTLVNTDMLKAIEIENTASGKVVAVSDSAARDVREIRILGSSYQGISTGANKVPYNANYTPGTTYTNDKGVTVTVNQDGSITLTGTPSIESGNVFYYTSGNAIDYLENGVEYKAYLDGGIRYTDSTGTQYVLSVTVDDSITDVVNYIPVPVYSYTDGMTIYPGIVRADYNGDYEPFTGGFTAPSINWQSEIIPCYNGLSELSVTADDSSVTIQPGHELMGIPVTDGGNYTDENGKQWTADEFCFSGGACKYIQRTKKFVLSTAANWVLQDPNKKIYYVTLSDAGEATPLCSFAEVTAGWNETVSYVASLKRFLVDLDKLGFDSLDAFLSFLNENGGYIVYELAVPVETDVEAEGKLLVGSGDTEFTNSAGAYMQIKYVADSKKYIDKKFEELQNAILSIGGNV